MILMTPPPSRPEPAQIDAIKTLDLAKTHSHALIRVPGSYPIDPELGNLAQESPHPTAKQTLKDESPNQKRHRAASTSQHVKKVKTIHEKEGFYKKLVLKCNSNELRGLCITYSIYPARLA